ncbi:hypothetical protein GPECTOR_547g557 [Gonium pectorale]|uniref:SBP-type domain-containing protein n=1 Tax=Gonium pectorale TaxID=33097 RepID=A0A150FWC1_GONPE|nr:hypothetical protein GPECTOR_547g557 [Gonium pectorale]|eukprot:KXZ41330.1 hypothetical protein GPECTOR_547g557 [Gonium pectorale]
MSYQAEGSGGDGLDLAGGTADGERVNQGAEVTANRCQADGCLADLSGLKRYFRRYHVCETHIRAQVVLISGRPVRFCDQCSTFHALSFFDGTRRWEAGRGGE